METPNVLHSTESLVVEHFTYGPLSGGRGYWLTIRFTNGRVDRFIRRSLEALRLKIDWICNEYEVTPDADGPATLYQDTVENLCQRLDLQ